MKQRGLVGNAIPSSSVLRGGRRSAAESRGTSYPDMNGMKEIINITSSTPTPIIEQLRYRKFHNQSISPSSQLKLKYSSPRNLGKGFKMHSHSTIQSPGVSNTHFLGSIPKHQYSPLSTSMKFHKPNKTLGSPDVDALMVPTGRDIQLLNSVHRHPYKSNNNPNFSTLGKFDNLVKWNQISDAVTNANIRQIRRKKQPNQLNHSSMQLLRDQLEQSEVKVRELQIEKQQFKKRINELEDHIMTMENTDMGRLIKRELEFETIMEKQGKTISLLEHKIVNLENSGILNHTEDLTGIFGRFLIQNMEHLIAECDWHFNLYLKLRKDHINLIYEKDVWRKEQDRSQIYDKLKEFVQELMEAGRHEKTRFRLAVTDWRQTYREMREQKTHLIKREEKNSQHLKLKEFEINELVKKNHRFKRFNNDLLTLIRKHGIRMKIQELTMDQDNRNETFPDQSENYTLTPDYELK